MVDVKSADKKEIPTFTKLRDDVAFKASVFRATSLLIGLISGILYACAMYFSYDEDPGYFKAGSVLAGVATGALVAGLLWCFALLILVPKGAVPSNRNFDTGAVYFISVYSAFMMVFDAGYRIMAVLKQSGIEDALNSDDRFTRIMSVMSIICIFASVGSAVCFFLRSNGSCGGQLKALIGLFPIIRAACGIGLEYFDMTVTMNNPVKLLSELSLITAMLFFLFEDRFDISDEKVRPRGYIMASLFAIVACAASALCGGSGFFFGVVGNGELVIESFFAFDVFLYAFVRLGAFIGFGRKKAKASVNTEVSEEAEEPIEAEEAEAVMEEPTEDTAEAADNSTEEVQAASEESDGEEK